MSSSPAKREIVEELRRRAFAGESTLEMLMWLKDDLAARGLDDPGARAFSMINMLIGAFDIDLSPARLVASERGHLTSEALVRRLGPLVPRPDGEGWETSESPDG